MAVPEDDPAFDAYIAELMKLGSELDALARGFHLGNSNQEVIAIAAALKAMSTSLAATTAQAPLAVVETPELGAPASVILDAAVDPASTTELGTPSTNNVAPSE